MAGFKCGVIFKYGEVQLSYSVPRRINLPAMLIHVLADNEAWVKKTELRPIYKSTDLRLLLQHILFLSLLLLDFLGAQSQELHLRGLQSWFVCVNEGGEGVVTIPRSCNCLSIGSKCASIPVTVIRLHHFNLLQIFDFRISND